MTKILYPYAEAAALIGLPSVQALRDLVYRRQGPVATRVGRRVLFAHSDLVIWADAHRDIATTPETTSVMAGASKRGRPSVSDRQQALKLGGFSGAGA